jgi:hypothetical protein
VHLDLFTLLDRVPMDRATLCRRLGTAPRPTDVMLTLCAANGFITSAPDGTFRTTPLGREFLVAGAACDARPYYASMAGRPGVDDWLKVLRTDKPASWPGEQGAADWHAAMRAPTFAEAFTAAMDCRGRVLAPAVAADIARRTVAHAGLIPRIKSRAATCSRRTGPPRSFVARPCRWAGACSSSRGPPKQAHEATAPATAAAVASAAADQRVGQENSRMRFPSGSATVSSR